MSHVSLQSGNVLDKFKLNGKTIVVTGAGRGLGLSFANGLAQVGANIAGVDLLDDPNEDFQKLTTYGGKAKYYRYVDLLDESPGIGAEAIQGPT